MSRTFTLIKHNLNKAKGQYLSFGIIICLTAFLMNIALVLAFQTFGAYDSRFEELAAADINVLLPQMLDDGTLQEELKALDGVLSVERHSGVYLTVTVREFAGADFEMNTVFYNLDEPRTLNLLDVSEGGNSPDGIYIPLYIKAFGGFAEGSDITYSIEGDEYTYKVGGIVSEMQYGNYGTGMIGGYFPKAAYEEFADKYDSHVIAEYSLKTADDVDPVGMKNTITDLLGDKGITALSISDRETAKQTRTMVCTLLIVIFLALAAIILVVSIFLSNFRIRSTIEDELAQMGVLKAIGYTGSLIICSVVVPYVLVGVIVTVAGAGLSYAVLPFVADILAIQSGFSYVPVFDMAALLAVVLVPTLAILLFSLLSAGKIRHLEPINAIRGITGNGGAGQNVLLAAVSFAIMVLLAFAGTLLYNVAVKPDNFMNTISEETPSVIFAATEDNLQELKSVLESDGRVELVLEYATATVSYADGNITAFVCEDFSKVTNDICYEGKSPASADEIAVGSALAERYPLGGTIAVTLSGTTADYTVTGYVQSVNNGGGVCQLTGGGYRKIGGTVSSLNVYLGDKNAEGFIKEYEDKQGALIAASINYEKLAESGRAVYAGIVSVVSVVLFVIAVLMVLLVLYVIIGSMISRRRQEFGIYKAIGYTSRQLTIKTACGFIPVVAGSLALSAVAGVWYLPIMNNAVFGLIGAVKNQFEVSLWITLALAAAFTAVAFFISVLLAAPIKRITAYSLLKD